MKKPLSHTSNYSMAIFWQPLLSFLYITSPSPSHHLSEEVYTVYQYHYINAARAMWLLPGVGELSTSTSSLNPWTLCFLQVPISVTPAIRPPAAITWLKCKGDEHDHHDEDEDQKEDGEKIGRRLGLGYAKILGLRAPHSFSSNFTKKNFHRPLIHFFNILCVQLIHFVFALSHIFSSNLIHYF